MKKYLINNFSNFTLKKALSLKTFQVKILSNAL